MENAFRTIACVVFRGLLWFVKMVPRRGLEPSTMPIMSQTDTQFMRR